MRLEQHYPVKGDPYLTDESGQRWRTLESPKEAAELPPETLVLSLRGGEGEPKPAGEYAGLSFPGDYPFLAGLVALGLPVYVKEDTP